MNHTSVADNSSSTTWPQLIQGLNGLLGLTLLQWQLLLFITVFGTALFFLRENKPARTTLRLILGGLLAVGLLSSVYTLQGASQQPDLGTLLTHLVQKLQTHLASNDGNHPFLFLIATAVVALLALSLTAEEDKNLRSVNGLLLGGFTVFGLAGKLLGARELWGWLLAMLPALLVIHHAVYLGRIRTSFIPKQRETLDRAADQDMVLKELLEANDRYFNPNNIALRYGLPALAIFAIGTTVFNCLHPGTRWALEKTLTDLNSGNAVEAARFGAMGAYVYVLLYLGQRSFRHDLTSGAALWCAVTLTLGPLTAAIFSKIWLQDTNNTPGPTVQALYFVLGMTPRHLSQRIAQLAQRLSADPAKQLPDRSVPLSNIRGIVPQIEERLSEEGIHDVASLAMADPLRLHRSTNFDKYLILAWIDEALLLHTLPEDWQDLQKRGIYGATKLAAYKPASGEQDEPSLQALMDGKPGETKALQQIARELAKDPQVQRIALLYQLTTGLPLKNDTTPAERTEQEDAQESSSEQKVAQTATEQLAQGVKDLPPTTSAAIPEHTTAPEKNPMAQDQHPPKR